jgi:cytoskeletal protein CcmA (bactofilin family)
MAATSNDLKFAGTSNQVTGLIEKGCEFEGKLCFYGTMRINGSFKGEIFTPDTLIIGEGGRVDGTIDAGVVIVSGEIHGIVKAKYRVEIIKPGVVRGEMQTPSWSLDEGAVFEGNCRMVRSPEL